MSDQDTLSSRDQSAFGFMGKVTTVQLPLKVGIVGATGIVGLELLKILKEQSFPMKELRVFGSDTSQSTWLDSPYGVLPVEKLNPRQIPVIDMVFMAAGSEVARRWGWRLARKGAFVIDKSSYFRDKTYAPLTVPEVNPEVLQTDAKIFGNPNCATIPIVHALKPLHDQFELKGFTAVSFQSVSGAGRSGVKALENELRDSESQPSAFSERIVDNVIPWIGDTDDSSSSEEKKIVSESRKILSLPRLPIRVTCVRVPVSIGHCVAIHADFRRRVDVDQAKSLLREFPGLELIDDLQDHKFHTPLIARGTDKTIVGRVRYDRGKRGLGLWVAVDNLRKGAALNAVQIAQILLKRLGK